VKTFPRLYPTNLEFTLSANAEPRCVPSYIDAVRECAIRLTGGSPRQLSKQRIRRIAKAFGCNRKYGERWWQTYKRVNLLPETANRMPEDVRAWVMQWFNLYKLACKFMIRHGFIVNRRTLLSYNYVYRQFMAWHDEWFGTQWEPTYKWWFNIIKTPKRLQQCEQNMQLVIKHMNKANMAAPKTIPFIKIS
jgi:hypothetical protein